jgi:hypothetical protein
VRCGFAALAVAAALAAGVPARSHVLVGRPGLRELVAAADAVALVELRSPLRLWRAAGGSDRRHHYRARALQVLKGETPPGDFDFFLHAEGLPDWEEGERALVFLERSEGRGESGAVAARFPFFSAQAPGQEWRIAPGDGAVLEAAQAWVTLGAGASAAGAGAPPRGAAGARAGVLRDLVLRELRSSEPRLREDGFRALVRLAGAPGFLDAPGTLASLAALADEASRPLAERVALTLLLSEQGGFDAAARLLALAAGAAQRTVREQALLIRSAAGIDDPPLSEWVAGQLAVADPALRREAASALTRPWHAAQVPALARAASDPEPGVARAALRSLAEIGGRDAEAALRVRAAETPLLLHRFAAAELRRSQAAPGAACSEAEPSGRQSN